MSNAINKSDVFTPPFTLAIRGWGKDGDDYVETFNSLDEIRGLIGTRQYCVSDANGKNVAGGDAGCFSSWIMGSAEIHQQLNP